MAEGALSGLRLIEMGQLIAGPFCGQLMADHGAEVIKIEPPGVGDAMRNWGQGIPLWFSVVARNKKSITLNLREKEGQAIVRQLAARADFLLENFRPGTLERWNLGWDELSAINEALIMIRVSGYGQTGPYSARAGYGGIGEAMGGMRYIAGEPDRPPSRAGLSIGDSLAATYACLGALMALEHRHRTGKGQVVDSAIYEAVLAMMESTVPEYTVAGHIRERTGSILPKVAPSNVYPTRDGSVLVAGNQDSVWKRLAAMMGVPELGDDPRYNSHVARGERQAELDEMIGEWTKQRTSSEVLELCEEHGVPAGNIYRAPEMLADPHFAAREAIVDVPHPKYENFRMQNVAPRLSATPGGIHWVGPELGQHNEEVYGELLGMDSRAMADLAERGII
ncbi:CaiB/BaiF CoA-transferase family protein [Erythrobacter sp. HL-111]|uniref:CaiB/BaiF CoA transferase family protein n=1 Tax=Erythrobacter sp. HL-111 TaxID=1798193 RepID=UPI0006DB7B49|nr:CoA transferase [Erythrobacter sp. HL-111]KPP94917.1 MAG: succinyl-CoA---D-citramalate CoA-transferase Sct [Erythrobacteraceae bacterium HL-111]SDS91186.1 succinyl-CoA---D-citramalate CoA-transferase [Erythrobacter sp. HL-111]